ncbi:MAG TPA: very short patch repair endonuclease [Mucilaginibacter sp.]|jgi:DNA mismatch endonuclease (patch repair protein)
MVAKNSTFETTPERSKLMKKIRSNDTKTEVLLRKSLWATGIRYRKNYKKLPGSPDIVITKVKVVVFIDGAFWHGHNWGIARDKIKNNQDYWIPKIERNMQRDIENNEALNVLGFKVIRFWEHEIKKDLQGCIDKILENVIITNLV